MATTLSGYITETRRLLHDVNANFWTDAELTDYINDGRNHLVQDTGCNRILQSHTVTASIETINFSDLPQGVNTIDVLTINLYWGNSRVPLYYMAWSNFNAQLRFWQNYNGRPVGFSMYGPKQVYIGPKPDQDYELELDTVVLKDPLTTGESCMRRCPPRLPRQCRSMRLTLPSTKSNPMARLRYSNRNIRSTSCRR
jgi:hypothetical protein